MAPLYGLTLFLSAFLLFWVEPVLGKLLLPVFGGAPATWNICLIFFQAALLGGYLYAHGLVRSGLSPRKTAGIHLALLFGVACLTPGSLREAVVGATVSSRTPAWEILRILTLSIGLPFLLLSATSSLLQSWFGRARARDPYFLYAASNLGSLLALLAFPWAIEPRFALDQQWVAWKTLYVGLAFLTGACALFLPRSSPRPLEAKVSSPVSRPSIARWVFWAFVPSSLMAGVTTYLSTDIVAMPLLWLAPLILYLGSFVYVFARPAAAHTSVIRGARIVLLVGAHLCVLGIVVGVNHPARLFVPAHLLTFFAVCLISIDRLAQCRPAPEALTRYYLWIAVGGVAGSAFNGLLAPLLFSEVSEYPLVMALACLGLPAGWGGRVSAAGVLVLYLVGSWGYYLDEQSVLVRERSFFGTLKVIQRKQEHLTYLVHGSTSHGAQSSEAGRSREALTYYARSGPVSQILEEVQKKHAPAAVGVIGLGAGSLAAYARTGERWTFFELDPGVIRLARESGYFSYLRDTAVADSLSIVEGDARLRIRESAEGGFSLLVVDAFSSDSVPAHLMTREALELYLRKLAPGGVLAFHISNRFLRLAPVVASVASGAGLVMRVRTDTLGQGPNLPRAGESASSWAIVARKEEDLGGMGCDARWKPVAADPRFEWRDDFYNLLGLIRW